MAFVRLQNPFITHHDIDQCVRTFKTIQSGEDRMLQLIAEKEIMEFDIQLIAYLLLFKAEMEELSIEIYLPFNEYNDNDNSVSFRLRQFRIYCYLMSSFDVYKVYIGNSRKPESLFDPEKPGKFRENSFVLSGYFMPLLFVSREEKNIYRLLFIEDLTKKDVNWFLRGQAPETIGNPATYFKEYSRKFMENPDPNKREDCIELLAALAFARALHSAHILPYYMASVSFSERFLKETGWNAGTLSKRTSSRFPSYEAFEYYKSIRPIFDELKTQPLVYTFIFSQLLAADLIPPLTLQNTSEVVQHLQGIWRFAMAFTNGIVELAKNIEQHASTHMGAVTALMSTKKSIPILLNSGDELNTIYREYYQKLPLADNQPAHALLDIQVIDLGTTGVTETLLAFTEEEMIKYPPGDPLHELLLEDKTLLEAGDCGFSDFLQSSNKNILNQQSKKAIAHFGLLTFSQQIIQNNGLLIASSRKSKKKRESVVIPYFPIRIADEVSIGTRYSVVLPIYKNQPFHPPSKIALENPLESNLAELKGLQSLFTIQDLDSGKPVQRKEGHSFLKRIRPDSRVLSNRADEAALKEKIVQEIQKLLLQYPNPSSLLINLDLRDCPINESQLLRLLAVLESSFPLITFLVSNIRHGLLNKLLILNEAFGRITKVHIPFWSRENIVLFYHYEETPAKEIFYFTDGLWGLEKDDFLRFNKLISRNHFNATTITTDKPVPREPGFMIPYRILERCPAFFNGSVLLPLDLLIPGIENNSIFEHNMLLLLKNDIKTNTIL